LPIKIFSVTLYGVTLTLKVMPVCILTFGLS